MIKQSEILTYFKSWALDLEARQYLRQQLPRYLFLLGKVEEVLIKIRQGDPAAPIKILNIGPAFETELMRQRFKEVIINSIGFENIYFKPRKKEGHIQFDLNEIDKGQGNPEVPPHDLVIMAEVIEHLYANPQKVLSHIHGWVEKRGFLIIQTPNAVRLSRRIRLLLGRNPQEMIRQDRHNPGHFREYTKEELLGIARETGFSLVEYGYQNYLGPGPRVKNILSRAAQPFLPAQLRNEIYIRFQKN